MNTQVPANLAATQPATYSLAIMDPVQFEHMQRVGKMLALSPLFPEHLRKGGLETAIANGVLVVNMALRLREDPLTVAQNIYFVGGKPGWMTTYLIAKANQHGVFDGPIEWKVEGQGDGLSVTAYATLARNGRVVSVTCDMALAKAEGWTSNKKYSSMPQQMLRYRTATWLVRLYCPEVMIGVPAAIDHDLPMRDVTPDESFVVARGSAEIDKFSDAAPVVEHDTETGEIVKAEPEVRTPETKAAEVAQASSQSQQAEAPRDPKKAEAALSPDRYRNLRDAIMRDLDQSGDPSGIKNFYGEVLDDMAINARDLFEEISARLEEMEAA